MVDHEISVNLKKRLFEMVIKIKSYDQNGEKSEIYAKIDRLARGLNFQP